MTPLPPTNWDETLAVSNAMRNIQDAGVKIPAEWDIKTIFQIYAVGFDVGVDHASGDPLN